MRRTMAQSCDASMQACNAIPIQTQATDTVTLTSCPLQPNFAALMSKAKANTQEQHGLASAKQAELEERRKKEAELEKRNAARERERRAKELEARQRRDQERLQLEERLRQEREKKRALKVSMAIVPICKRLHSSC